MNIRKTIALGTLAVVASLTLFLGSSTSAIARPSQTTVASTTGDLISDVVQAHSSELYSVFIAGGEWTRIGVRGDGDTDLDLFVYDQAGNLVARHNDLGDLCLVEFGTWIGQTYTIEVRNLGSVYNRFMLGIE